MEHESVNLAFRESFIRNWNRPALSNYKECTITYADLSSQIMKMHLLYKNIGIGAGDKIAICSKNQINWVMVFVSALTYGAVPVPIMNEFSGHSIMQIACHADSRLLFVDDAVWKVIKEENADTLDAVFHIRTFKPLFCKDEALQDMADRIESIFEDTYPSGVCREDLRFYPDSSEEIAIINYTSGTTGNPKGVMIPYRAILSNMSFARKALPQIDNTAKVVSILPSSHMYGLMFEVLYELVLGCHVYFISRLPSPQVILQAFSDIRPTMIISVPLVIEKIYRSRIIPILQKLSVRIALKIPFARNMVYARIRAALTKAFGGEFYQVIIGGSAMNKEVEKFFRAIGFPFTIGYGMTECAPIICYDDWKTTRLHSCGIAVPDVEVRIDSENAAEVPGEILVKGPNVFKGYYKNESATGEVLDEDGWFHTGDVGIMDDDGYLYIKGRSKCMILGASGQNIYPEELESILDDNKYIQESLVKEKGKTLIALVYPDYLAGESEGLNRDEVTVKIKESLPEINAGLPRYARLKEIIIMTEPFVRTPKKSIKRNLYTGCL